MMIQRLVGFWFTLLLLMSNGMISTVVDICCLELPSVHPNSLNHSCSDEHIVIPQKSPESVKPTCCTPVRPTNTCESIDHNSCDYFSYYYFTPKYFENSNSTVLTWIFKTDFLTSYSKPFKLKQIDCHKFHKNKEGPPKLLTSKPSINTLDCVWII